MRVMVIVKASTQSEAGQMPSPQLLADMGKFNEELIAAGVMLDGGGLHPTSKGARVQFSGKERVVTSGPFGNTSELVSGYWIWKVTRSTTPSIGSSVVQTRCRKRPTSKFVHCSKWKISPT